VAGKGEQPNTGSGSYSPQNASPSMNVSSRETLPAYIPSMGLEGQCLLDEAVNQRHGQRQVNSACAKVDKVVTSNAAVIISLMCGSGCRVPTILQSCNRFSCYFMEEDGGWFCVILGNITTT
jgi:hypothetical protein